MLESGGEKTQPVPQKQRRNACMAVLLLTIVIAVGGCVGEMGFDGIIGGGHMINNAYAEESVLLVTNETAKLTARDGAVDDWFGRSVSVYNNTAVIGAYFDDDKGPDSGSAYIFEKNSTSGNWTQTETVKLTASDGVAGDYFGYSVSVYNNTAVIGAVFDDDNGSNSGSAYVFEKNSTSGNWTQTETVKLTASDGVAGDYFGYSVSVYNNTAVISAYGDDDNGPTSGSAYVFEKNSTSGNWTQTETVKLTASDGVAGDYFGNSVSVYNNTAVIGAYGDDDNGPTSGSAYVFEKNSTSGNWTQTETVKLTASDGVANDNFGYSVSVYNNTAVIGAYFDDDKGPDSGSAYIFEKNSTSGNWTQTETVKLTASDGEANDNFGYSVSVYNNTAVIGAVFDDDNGFNSGSAYVFEKNSTSGNWTQTETVKLTASDGEANDFFGYSVSVYNNTAVIGAFFDDDKGPNSGSAYVFSVDTTSPTLQNVTISSNNTNSTLAANGDTVTLSFTASESIANVTATIGNATATVSGGGTNWNATRALDGTEPQGALSFTINFDDLAGNSGVQVNATTDSSAVTADFTAPTLNSVVILSSNTDSTLAANGDTVTLSFTASESIANVTATIGNATATVSGGGTNWNATRALDGTEPQGALSFTINFDDLAGNSGVQINATTDSSAVTADFTAPTLNSVVILSSNTDSTLAANGDTVTLSFTASESIANVTATIGNATATVSGGGTNWNATRALDGTEPQGALSFTINFDDLAGNSGVQVNATTDSSAVTVTILDTDGSGVTNQTPTANAGDDQTVGEGTKKVTLNGSKSSDPDGDTITYAWSQTQGPTVTLFSSTSESPRFDAPLINSNQAILTFSLTVNDGAVDSTPDTVDITVLDTDDVLLTSPGSPSGSSGSSSSGSSSGIGISGGGGGSSSSSGIGISGGGGGRGSSTWVDDIYLKSVSWDCNTGTIKIIAGPDSDYISVAVHTTQLGIHQASMAGDDIPGYRAFVSPMHKTEDYINIKVVALSGRNLVTISESIDVDACVGERTYHAPDDSTTTTIKQPVPKQEDDKDRLADFVDPKKNPQYYIDRYNNEIEYREWFDENYPGITIYEAVGLPVPDPTLEPAVEQEPTAVEQEPAMKQEPEPICDPRAELVDGFCIPLTPGPEENGGGCLIATAAYGTELAPQVQLLREIRDNTVLQTQSGSAFMDSFNSFYYSFSPSIADLERQNPVFREAVKMAVTPLISSLAILDYVDIDSESEMLGYGIGIVAMNIAMYVALPVSALYYVRRLVA